MKKRIFGPVLVATDSTDDHNQGPQDSTFAPVLLLVQIRSEECWPRFPGGASSEAGVGKRQESVCSSEAGAVNKKI
jgi:hypothetical protein